jgi:hypothetical protein
MPASMQLPQDAARLWTDPSQRDRIVAMHAEERPLVEMCEELGLGAALDRDGLRAVLEQLSPGEVAAIREAFVAESASSPGPGANFPVDCRVDDVTGGVRVVSQRAGAGATGPIARIESA